MSASYENNHGLAYSPYGKLTEYDEAIIGSLFDQDTDEEENMINKSMQEESFMRKVVLIKTILYPIELALTYFILGKKWTEEKRESQKLYWAFLRKKISYNQFQRSIVRLINNAPLGA